MRKLILALAFLLPLLMGQVHWSNPMAHVGGTNFSAAEEGGEEEVEYVYGNDEL
ncbi:unnamed protein product, partial [marine sediment metagenome]